MLSRVADSLYWLGRYVERAENIARFVDVSLLLGEAAQVVEPMMASRGIAFAWEDHTGGAILHGDRRGLAAALQNPWVLSAFALVFLGAFYPILLNTIFGVRSVDPKLFEAKTVKV